MERISRAVGGEIYKKIVSRGSAVKGTGRGVEHAWTQELGRGKQTGACSQLELTEGAWEEF